MKPQDVIDQLVGEFEDVDFIGDGDLALYGCKKFEGRDAAILFSKGLVEIYTYGPEIDGHREVIATERFAIRATLESITE